MSALCLYTVTGWGVMSCVCSMAFLCGSTLVKIPLLQADTVAIWITDLFFLTHNLELLGHLDLPQTFLLLRFLSLLFLVFLAQSVERLASIAKLSQLILQRLIVTWINRIYLNNNYLGFEVLYVFNDRIIFSTKMS